ncbi:MAG: SDR family oxidoreductase [Alphaproteobacteria bacterium]|jgi:hypothetical protein|nr:SDR family oxidoreductase [Alphaproteobacteria bacterium]
MELELAGRTALITGGSKGIGRACAESLAAEGLHLHLAARGKEALAETKDKILRNHQVSIETHALDLSDSEAQQELSGRCPDIDILVNNAGAIPGGTVASIDEGRWREAWDLKVFGYINLCRIFHARMASRGQGVIVNVIGLAGEAFNAGYIAGSTGNAGLMAFTRALGSTSLDDGVRVVGVNPGLVETGRMVTLMEQRAEAEFGDKSRWRDLTTNLPAGRAAKPEEVANLVTFLASERAAYTTGVIYSIDGGAAARHGL